MTSKTKIKTEKPLKTRKNDGGRNDFCKYIKLFRQTVIQISELVLCFLRIRIIRYTGTY